MGQEADLCRQPECKRNRDRNERTTAQYCGEAKARWLAGRCDAGLFSIRSAFHWIMLISPLRAQHQDRYWSEDGEHRSGYGLNCNAKTEPGRQEGEQRCDDNPAST